MSFQKKENDLSFPGNSDPLLRNELILPHPADNNQNDIDEDDMFYIAAIVEFSADSIVSRLLDGTVKSWNKGSEKLYGYTATEMINENLSLLIPAEFIDKEKNTNHRLSNNQFIEPYETLRIKRNGDRIYVSLTVSALKNREGKIIGASEISRDITSQKKFETALITANQQLAFQNEEKEKRAQELVVINGELQLAESRLKEVNKELEAFTYSVSHDLRAPLRAVNSYSQILIEDYGQDLCADGRQILENIRYNTKKMGALIDELLSFSRLGRKEIERRDLDMNELIQSVLDDIKRTTDHHASIHVGPMPIVRADHTLLHQVLFNLVSNAVKYSSKKEHPQIEISAAQQNNKTIFYS